MMQPKNNDSRESERSLSFGKNQYPITVLLVDDRPLVAEMLGRLLSPEEDIRFHYCENGTSAIPIAVEVKPTVILLDLVMPEIDGLMLLRFFRANPATQAIPIVVLSSQEEAQLKAEAFSLGASDYLIKFPDRIELVARIRYHSLAYINGLKQKEAYRSLELLRATLEERVEERTKKLQQTQAQLVQADKMSALGQLLAGIAHEINNPINFISGNISSAIEYTQDLLKLLELYQQIHPQPNSEIQELKEAIDWEFASQDLPHVMSSLQLGAERIKEIVTTMRNFSRKDGAEKKCANIHECIDSSLLILHHRFKSANIQIIKDYERDLPSIECYPGQLNQVFLNLLANAADSFAPSESSGNLQPPIRTIRIRTENRGNTVAIAIADNGSGIPSEIQQHLFEPFFTTKPVGKGTGLGLSIGYSIVVEKHQGSLRCRSKVGEGTEFTIELPLSDRACLQRSNPAIESRSPVWERKSHSLQVDATRSA